MCNPWQSEADAAKAPVCFDVAEYTNQVFEMYDGEPVTVELWCKIN